MFRYCGRFVDHDDKVEENALATSFDETARAWQMRFGVPYSTCGCPLPSQPFISRLVSKLGLASTSSIPSAALTSLSPSPDDADVTHASEHNSLVLPAHPSAVKKRNARMKELEARQRKADREVEKQIKRSEKDGSGFVEEEEVERRRREHDAAFFYPYPLMPYYGPVGYPVAVGGCCSIDGNSAQTSADNSGGSGSACGARRCSQNGGACGSSGGSACASSYGFGGGGG
ncbi:hypothetical protein JCM8547_007131, partial [Rhodosporidiobolus lusitaniae]